jgi:hypothetical protein
MAAGFALWDRSATDVGIVSTVKGEQTFCPRLLLLPLTFKMNVVAVTKGSWSLKE